MTSPAKKAPRRGADKPDPFAEPPAQRDLTPAPVAPAANDEARAAIATINTQLSEIDKVEAGVVALETRYAKVAYPVNTKKGMDEACAARLEIRKPRFAVEAARKAAKAPVLKLGRDIDARAAAIEARLLAIETPIDDQIKAQERKEAQRKADLEARLVEIRGTPQRCIGKSATQLQEVLAALESLPLADFAEYREQAAKAQFDAAQSVQVLLLQARQAEELAALREKQRKEESRKAAIHQAIDAIGAPLGQLPMCRTSARVQGLIDNVEAIEIPEAVYQEFAAAAREKKAAVLAELVKARDEKKAAEDARAAAAAAPAPTTAPQRYIMGGMPDADYRAPAAAPSPVAAPAVQPQPGHEGGVGRFGGPVGRRMASDFNRVFASPPPAAQAGQVVDAEVDPFTAPLPATAAVSTVIPLIPNERPADAEILAVLADHYDTDPTTAAAWLRTFDADAALRQLALQLA